MNTDPCTSDGQGQEHQTQSDKYKKITTKEKKKTGNETETGKKEEKEDNQSGKIQNNTKQSKLLAAFSA